jgi:SAM-dependent methyltransferase
MPNFQEYSKYYDLLYKDKKYKEESDYVIKKIKSFSANAQTILELGSGSGSHAHFFCDNSYQVTGIERSPEMVEQSLQKKINNFTPVVGDIVTTKLSNKFDVVISLFHVISYLNENQSLIDCFKNVHDHLNSEGVFIFDVWYSPAVYSQKPETRIKRLENSAIDVIRIAESEMISSKNVVNVNFEVIIKDKKTNQVQVLKELHPMRHFSIPEIEMLAKMTNFELIHSEEFLTEKKPSENTWGVCFILKKKDSISTPL